MIDIAGMTASKKLTSISFLLIVSYHDEQQQATQAQQT